MDNVLAAAIRYTELKERHRHPQGRFDNAGRWYPKEQFSCCCGLRSPTKSYPYSLMIHCRTLKHICNEFNVEEKEVRYVLKNPPLMMGSNNSWINERIEKVFRGEQV